MTLDETTAAQPARNLPLRWRLWFIAGLLLTGYSVYVVLYWTNQLEYIPAELSTLAHICVIVLVLAGCIDVALSRMNALGGKLDGLIAHLEVVGQLVAIAQANTAAIRRLEAARTIDLHNRLEAEAQLRDAIRFAKAEAVKVITERLDGMDQKLSVVEELMERFRDLEADLASFRLWQKRSETTVSANGKAVALRVLPSQPD